MQETVTVEGAKFWTVRLGAGVPLVCLHGGPGLWDQLEPLGEVLMARHTVFRYDQRGCGRSTGEGPFTLAQALSDLEALRKHWHVEKWVVLGHSFGATLALAYALQHPQHILGVVCLCGTGISMEWQETYRLNRNNRLGEGGRQMLQHRKALWQQDPTEANEQTYCRWAWSSDFADPQQGLKLAQHLLRPGARINTQASQDLLQDAGRLMRGWDLEALQVPALVLHGAQDPRPSWPAREVANRLPQGGFVKLPDVGHFPWLEDLAGLERVLVGFLSGLS